MSSKIRETIKCFNQAQCDDDILIGKDELTNLISDYVKQDHTDLFEKLIDSFIMMTIRIGSSKQSKRSEDELTFIALRNLASISVKADYHFNELIYSDLDGPEEIYKNGNHYDFMKAFAYIMKKKGIDIIGDIYDNKTQKISLNI